MAGAIIAGQGGTPIELGALGRQGSGQRVRQLFDVHAHFVPDRYREAAVAAGYDRPDGMPGLPAWSESSMLEAMDRMGIETAILSISSPGVHFGDNAAARALARDVNVEGARLVAAHPGRLGFFASLPLPDVEGALHEIAFALDELGADGIVMESNHHGVYPGDEAFEPILAELDRRGAVLFLHPTSPNCQCCGSKERPLPRPVLEFMFETTRAVTNLVLSGSLQRHQEIKLIIPHAGGSLSVMADRIAAAASILPNMAGPNPNTVIELLGRLYYDLAGAPVPRQLPALRTIADSRKLLYGSDWPFTPAPAVERLWMQLESFLAGDSEFLEQIKHRNAYDLFPKFRAVRAN